LSADRARAAVGRGRFAGGRGGIVVVIAEVDSESGTLLNAPEIITRGFNYPEKDNLSKRLVQSIQAEIKQNPEQNADWTYYRKLIRQKAESLLFKEKREPLVIPVVLEV
jgi:mRNA degradation ribonuclease J1/J2